jgi:hypothetical protein
MLTVSASYLEKQKSFIPKKKFFGRSQYQNKKALFTDSIFREGFVHVIQDSTRVYTPPLPSEIN